MIAPVIPNFKVPTFSSIRLIKTHCKHSLKDEGNRSERVKDWYGRNTRFYKAN